MIRRGSLSLAQQLQPFWADDHQHSRRGGYFVTQSVLKLLAQRNAPHHPDIAIGLFNLAYLLMDTQRFGEAEPLLRRVLAIDEQAYGAVHPNVANDLANLARLLRITNRMGEAEPLLRRMLDIFLNLTGHAGHLDPNLQDAVNKYASLLESMGMNNAEIRKKLNDLGENFGMSLS